MAYPYDLDRIFSSCSKSFQFLIWSPPGGSTLSGFFRQLPHSGPGPPIFLLKVLSLRSPAVRPYASPVQDCEFPKLEQKTSGNPILYRKRHAFSPAFYAGHLRKRKKSSALGAGKNPDPVLRGLRAYRILPSGALLISPTSPACPVTCLFLPLCGHYVPFFAGL